MCGLLPFCGCMAMNETSYTESSILLRFINASIECLACFVRLYWHVIECTWIFTNIRGIWITGFCLVDYYD